jgi:two-component system sensor histidine kinase HydH
MQIMSAPSLQSDSGAAPVAAERYMLDAAIALAPTISLERVAHETAQQLRRAIACDAIAIALSDAELGLFELVHQVGFDDDGRELTAALLSSWMRAVSQGITVLRDRERAKEITVPIASGRVRGAITILVGNTESPRQLEEIEGLVASIGAQAASAIDRARDVDRLTQRRRLEAISEVSAGIARELRNPLFGISSAAQLLRFRVRDDPVVERNVGRILREVERLNGIVSSLLDYGRPAPLHTSPADPDSVWHSVLTAKRGLLESKALVVRHRPSDPRGTCDIDTEQIARVFENVLSNAVDAAPEGSDLTVVSTILASGEWRCRLHNDGPPIPPEILPRVFELFFSTKPGGAGVGLPLCQRILDDHGGSISLESTADTGTTVTISLPNHRTAEVKTADTHG